MKKDDLLEQALHMYRSGCMVTKIAEECGLNRRTAHRWIKEAGAKRSDYEEAKQARYEEIKRKAQEKATKEEQLKEYVLNMGWDVMTNCLPTMGVRTVNDFDKLDRMIRRAIDTTNQWGSIG